MGPVWLRDVVVELFNAFLYTTRLVVSSLAVCGSGVLLLHLQLHRHQRRRRRLHRRFPRPLPARATARSSRCQSRRSCLGSTAAQRARAQCQRRRQQRRVVPHRRAITTTNSPSTARTATLLPLVVRSRLFSCSPYSRVWLLRRGDLCAIASVTWRVTTVAPVSNFRGLCVSRVWRC